MSIASIVTRGFGSFGSISEIVTRGYSIGAAISPSRITGLLSIQLSISSSIALQPSINASAPLLQPSIKGNPSIN